MTLPEPRATRPRFGGGYGIASDPEGMLPWSWAEERLEAGRNYWISTAGADGRPHAMPVWGVWRGDGVLFGTNARSRKARNLDRDPRVVVHLESGDEVVILEGEAETVGPPDKQLADAFERKYHWRPSPEEDADTRWYLLRPRRALAWLEREYRRTATRFAFD